MTEEQQLTLLKCDLQRLNSTQDNYLKNLLTNADSLMLREGIINDESVDYYNVKIHYAAFLFRRRAQEDMKMPRFLRYELNNILLSQKGS